MTIIASGIVITDNDCHCLIPIVTLILIVILILILIVILIVIVSSVLALRPNLRLDLNVKLTILKFSQLELEHKLSSTMLPINIKSLHYDYALIILYMIIIIFQCK